MYICQPSAKLRCQIFLGAKLSYNPVTESVSQSVSQSVSDDKLNIKAAHDNGEYYDDDDGVLGVPNASFGSPPHLVAPRRCRLLPRLCCKLLNRPIRGRL